MEGVILFADNSVFKSGTFENSLFSDLNTDAIHPVLPIDSIAILEKTTTSISTFRAIILDWNFQNDTDDLGGAKLPEETPLSLLENIELFSLIFIYSRTEIGTDIKTTLKKKFGDKIEFILKGKDNDVKIEKEKLLKSLTDFEQKNLHLKTPFIWSMAINKSVQSIFSELETADPNWIKEIYLTAKTDHAEPITEVIGVFQNLLNESIIQNSNLIKALAESATLADVFVANKEVSLAKLFNRIYYTKLLATVPIMTGDIFKFTEDEFAILITPECDVNTKQGIALEFLKFTKSASALFIAKKKKDEAIFNNGVPSRHILPSFPFIVGIYNTSAMIDFESAFIVRQKNEFENIRHEFKLNSPYIYQLRQRYLAYIGRVGVPAIPQSLKAFNLK